MEFNDIFNDNIDNYSFLSNDFNLNNDNNSNNWNNIEWTKEKSTNYTTLSNSNNLNNIKKRNRKIIWEDIEYKGIKYKYEDNPIIYRKIRKNLQNRESAKKIRNSQKIKKINDDILIQNLQKENQNLTLENSNLKQENSLIKAQIEFLEKNIMKNINKEEIIINMDDDEKDNIIRQKDSSISNKIKYVMLIIFTKILLVTSYIDYNNENFNTKNDLKSFQMNYNNFLNFLYKFLFKFMIYIVLVILLFLIK